MNEAKQPRKDERYPLESSPFMRVPTGRALARLLNIEIKDLKRLVKCRREFYWFDSQEINGKARDIQAPIGPLKKVHERIKSLFNRIQRPEYLHSPRRGSTYVTNAAVHDDGAVIAKLDIRRFYPSTTNEHLFRFLHHQLKMLPDVAGLLTKLCTIDGKMPFGSPLSPILCFHIHRQLFDRIEALCTQHGLVMTLYVDDITISGAKVPGPLVSRIKTLIHQAHLRYHKVRRIARHRQPVITGVRLTTSGRMPTLRKQVEFRDRLRELDSTTDPILREPLLNSLLGRSQSMLAIYEVAHPARQRAERRHNWLRNEYRRLRNLRE